MVSSINPGAIGAGALGLPQKYERAAPTQLGRTESGGDRIDASAWAAARDSVRSALSLAHEALAVGHDAQAMLLQVRDLARSGAGADSQAALDGLLSGFADRVAAAIARGVRLLEGGSVAVAAEPGAEPVELEGVDLRLKPAPSAKDLIQVGAGARADDPSLAQNAQLSLDRLQGAMERLMEAARALEAHHGFLGAVEGAGVRHNLDADAARLLALQARQGLSAVGDKPIANADPQAVLSLFRA